jgi:hypothetical protein
VREHRFPRFCSAAPRSPGAAGGGDGRVYSGTKSGLRSLSTGRLGSAGGGSGALTGGGAGAATGVGAGAGVAPAYRRDMQCTVTYEVNVLLDCRFLLKLTILKDRLFSSTVVQRQLCCRLLCFAVA